MEGVSVKVYKSLKGYWTKRHYERLDSTSCRPPVQVATEIGEDPIRKRRKWGIKIGRKIKIRFSPKTFLRRMRDAYMNFMLRFANSGLIGPGGLGGDGVSGFGSRPIKEYDEKIIIEIYKSILKRRDSPMIGSQQMMATTL
ncbi:uncharacterized protein LOC124921577 [Impatiens glandulifera]|uniref:uncharacterized protein LOC124921577 n=1 Tax=Impatiens glandulifera TaxID=253017 RepID=UPI001FB093AD|nr:uncharacterized protein LOC124921577 [Impatiens glandulifera]